MTEAASTAVSQAYIARALGLSPAAITKLKGQGMPVDSVEAAQAWRTERQNIAQRKPLPSAVAQPAHPIIVAREVGDFPTEDHDSARTRLRIAEANQAEMVEAEMRGDLIRVAAVRSAWARWVSSLADALDQLAPRMTPVLVAESDAGKVHAAIQAEADQIKRLLSSMRGFEAAA